MANSFTLQEFAHSFPRPAGIAAAITGDAGAAAAGRSAVSYLGHREPQQQLPSPASSTGQVNCDPVSYRTRFDHEDHVDSGSQSSADTDGDAKDSHNGSATPGHHAPRLFQLADCAARIAYSRASDNGYDSDDGIPVAPVLGAYSSITNTSASSYRPSLYTHSLPLPSVYQLHQLHYRRHSQGWDVEVDVDSAPPAQTQPQPQSQPHLQPHLASQSQTLPLHFAPPFTAPMPFIPPLSFIDAATHRAAQEQQLLQPPATMPSAPVSPPLSRVNSLSSELPEVDGNPDDVHEPALAPSPNTARPVVTSQTRLDYALRLGSASRHSSASVPDSKVTDPPLGRTDIVNSLIQIAAVIVDYVWLGSAAAPSAVPAPGTAAHNASLARSTLATRIFIHELLRRSGSSFYDLQLALFYLVRLRTTTANPSNVVSGDEEQQRWTRAPPVTSDPRRAFLACLMLACKYLDDLPRTARSWSRLAGVPLWQVNRLERDALLAIGHALHVPSMPSPVSVAAEERPPTKDKLDFALEDLGLAAASSTATATADADEAACAAAGLPPPPARSGFRRFCSMVMRKALELARMRARVAAVMAATTAPVLLPSNSPAALAPVSTSTRRLRAEDLDVFPPTKRRH